MGFLNSGARQPHIPEELIYFLWNSLWNFLPGELWKIFAAHSLGCWQTFLYRPGVRSHGVAQLQSRWLVFGLQSVTGCLPENDLRGHRAGLTSGGQRKICTAILKPGAVHLVHGLPLTRTNRAHLRRGHSPNKPRYTSRVTFRLKRIGTKEFLHVSTIRGPHNYNYWGRIWCLPIPVTAGAASRETLVRIQRAHPVTCTHSHTDIHM